MSVQAPTIFNFFADSGTVGDGITDADVLTLWGKADAGTTVKVYDGVTLLGTVTASSSGAWTFETPKLANSAHSFTATETDAQGNTSTPSASLSVTVVPSVTYFSGASDNWSNPITIDNQPWFVENPNQSWSLTEPDSHTIRVEVRPGDTWADDGTSRSEILTVNNALDHQVFNAAYRMTIEPGTPNPVAWLSITQMHENAGIPFSIQLVGDHMAVLVNQTASAPISQQVYYDPNPIIRGHAYDMQIRANFSTDSTGFLEIWRDGVEIVDYHGQLGTETGGQYLKLGIYQGWTNNVTYSMAVDYSNIVLSYNNPSFTVPPFGAPTIASYSTDSGVAGDGITNDNTLTLTGTAPANNTVKIYDGTTLLGSVTADSNGAWSLATGTLADGTHNFTATATDASGNTSVASNPLAVTVDTVAPANPVITSFTPDTGTVGDGITSASTLTLSGTAEPNSTVTVYDGGTLLSGSATTNSSGVWTFTTAELPNGNHTFTAVATDAAGNTSVASTALPVTIAGAPPPNLVINGGFETGDLSGWTLGANATTSNVYMVSGEHSGQFAAGMGPVGTDGTLSQTIQTTAGQHYTLDFWLWNGSSGPDDFSVKWNGATLMSLVNTSAQGWTEYTYDVVGTGGPAVLQFAFRQDPSEWHLDDITLRQVTSGGPTVSSVATSGTGITNGAGDLNAGHVVTLTVNLSAAVTIAGGTPTLTLNDGGTATYTGGSGSNALTFSYTVAAGQNTADLTVTAVNLGTATVKDAAGNAANLTGAVTNPAGTLQIDTTAPTVSSEVASGPGIVNGAGTLGVGSVVTLTLNLSEAVTVAGGTPTLTLNDGGTATYTGGSGSSALTFSYTVAAGQNTADLTVTAVNLGTATVKDAGGNAANLTGAVANPAGTLAIDTTAPTVSSEVASGPGIVSGAGTLGVGSVVTLTLNLSEAVTVAGGTPTLTLNDGGTATYTGGSGSSALTFSYTVAAGQNTADLTVTAVNLGTATVKDAAGNAANLTGAVTNPAGTLQIDTTAPTVSSEVASGTGIVNGAGTLGVGSVVTLTLNLSEAVTVAGGTPTLTLNDGGTATYTGGSGSNALTFSYTVAAGQNTADLTVTAVNLGTATVKDAGGNAADLTGAVTNPAGTLQIDTTAPTVSSEVASGTGIVNGAGTLGVGSVVTLTLNLSEAVTVAGGTPTLTLNDGGTATYTGGSGSNALTFSYTVAAGQNTADLTVTAVNLGTATVKDAGGNAANLTGAVANPAGTLQIDTTAPTAPAIVSVLPDSNIAGDGITNATVLTLTGTAVANSTVNLYDGGTLLGSVAANGSGAWAYITAALPDGTHNFTATDTDAVGNNSAPSTTLAVTVDTQAPAAPLIANDTVNGSNTVTLTGSAEANSTVKVYEGATLVGSAMADVNGAWTFTTSQLSNGSHIFAATDMDRAGNTSATSSTIDPIIAAPNSLDPVITGLVQNKNGTVTIRGTGDPNTQMSVYDNNHATPLASVTVKTDGTWSITTKLSNTVHSLTGQEVDSAGHVGATPGVVLWGTDGQNVLAGGGGNDLFYGRGGADVFVFTGNFGNDTIADFRATGSGHDIINLSQSTFSNYASILAHAAQVGQNVVITADPMDTLTLKNVLLTDLHSYDFHLV